MHNTLLLARVLIFVLLFFCKISFAYQPSFTISNFPATQNVSGTVQVGNFPAGFNVLNFPAVQTVSGTFWQATQPVSLASIPLATGAATSANQATMISSLSSIDSKLSAPISVSTGLSPLTDAQLRASPLAVTGTFTSSSDATAANQVTQISRLTSIDNSTAAINTKLPSGLTVSGTRLLVELPAGGGGLTDAELRASPVPVSGTLSISTAGLATDTNQTTQISRLTSIDSTLTSSLSFLNSIDTNTGAALTDAQLRASPLAVSGTVVVGGTTAVSAASLPLPTGAATETTLAALNTKIPSSPAQDRTTAASPSAIRLSDGSAFYKATTPSDTQPISAASLPLPTGAATAANQSTANGYLNSIESSAAFVAAAVGLDGAALPTNNILISGSDGTNAQNIKTNAAGELIVVTSGTTTVSGTVAISGTAAVSAASLPLPTGAATESTLSSINTKTPALGQATMANSSPVVIASNQTAVPISASSLPLPTGASTLAEQQTQTTALQLIDDGISTTGAAVPAKGFQATGTDGTNARALKTDSGGELQVDVLTVPTVTVTNGGTFAVQNTESRPSTATVANVASSATNVTCLASNTNRRKAAFFNDSTQVVYLKFGATASSSSFTVRIAAGGYYEIPTPVYTGIVDCIWASANGSMRVTEY